MISQLYLFIGRTLTDGDYYRVERLKPPLDSEVRHGFTLTKRTGEQHTVAQNIYGWGCSCGDFTFRRDKRGDVCKHIASLEAVGLIEVQT